MNQAFADIAKAGGTVVRTWSGPILLLWVMLIRPPGDSMKLQAATGWLTTKAGAEAHLQSTLVRLD